MADVIGPCSTLPGHRSKSPAGMMCDKHPDSPAVVRYQGETDSFGAELHDLCQECLDEIDSHNDESRSGCCDWCKKEATDLRYRRDWTEGACGPVYRVCGACVVKENEALQEELDGYDDYIDYDDDGFYDEGEEDELY